MQRSYSGMLFTGALVAGCLTANAVYASGFALIENSASGQGNAFAGAAAVAEDASTIFFNPAGMTRIHTRQLVTAGHLIFPTADFDNKGSSQSALLGGGSLTGGDDDGGNFAIVPNLYYVHPWRHGLTFGVGINAPFGLKTEYDDDWVGRYHSVTSDVTTININPSVAYKVNPSLSVAAGIDVQYIDVRLSSAVDFGAICVAALGPGSCASLGALPQQADGFADLNADNKGDLTWGFNFGLLYELGDSTRIGLAYRSEVEHNVKGDADFSVPSSASFVVSGGAFIDTDLKATVTLPRSASLSAYHKLTGKLALLADATWTEWSVFEELRIKFDNPNQPDAVTTEDWDNTWRFSLGAIYQLNNQWLLRGGLAYDQTPVPGSLRRTPRVPGNDRKWVSVGLTYFYNSAFTVDVGYSHLFIPDTDIDNTLESSVPTLAATLNGSYEASVDILSAQLRWSF